MVRLVEKYVAFDGQEFDTQVEAADHESQTITAWLTRFKLIAFTDPGPPEEEELREYYKTDSERRLEVMAELYIYCDVRGISPPSVTSFYTFDEWAESLSDEDLRLTKRAVDKLYTKNVPIGASAIVKTKVDPDDEFPTADDPFPRYVKFIEALKEGQIIALRQALDATDF